MSNADRTGAKWTGWALAMGAVVVLAVVIAVGAIAVSLVVMALRHF